MEENKTGRRGGRRENAGRKQKYTDLTSIYIYCERTQKDRIKEEARKEKKSLSDYILGKLDV